MEIMTPARWSMMASEGRWSLLSYLQVVNRELLETMASRYRGVGRHILMTAPPQHGKTTIVGHSLPCDWLGHFPDDNIILSSYEAETAEERGKTAKEEFEAYAPGVFNLTVDPNASASSHWGVKGRRGSMKCRGIGGAITGSPCDLFINDDPIKDAKTVASETFRRDQWEWYMKVMVRRFRKHTCSVTIYTPWHEDDLGQRMIHASVAGNIPPLKVLRFPAIAETQEDRDEWAYRMGLPLGEPDPAGRQPGEALWPDAHPIESLLRWRKADPHGFESLAQGRPRAKGGTIFKGEWIPPSHYIKQSAVPKDVERVRFWDKAGSDDAGDWTVGVRMSRSPDGRYFIENVVRDRLSSFRRDEKILQTSRSDRDSAGNTVVRMAQDPGSAGKVEAAHMVNLLDGFDVKITGIESGDKATRFGPFCSSAEGGNVYMVEGPWNKSYIDELESFDKGKWDDQVDATSGCHAHLSGGTKELSVAPYPFHLYRGRVAS